MSASDNVESISDTISISSDSTSSSDSSEHRELLPLDKAKNGVWQYFGFPATNADFAERDKKKRTEVFCKLCPNKLNYQGSTTNMIVHLQYNHRFEYMKVKSKMIQPGRSSSSSSQMSSKQLCITESFELLQTLPRSSKR